MRFYRMTLVLACTLLIIGNTYALQNLDTLRQELMHYHDSGLYEKEQWEVVKKAKQAIATRITHKTPDEKLAIVFDIDETALSNYPNMASMRFGGTLQAIHEAESKGNDKAITPTLNLYHDALKKHLYVFFITGRKTNNRLATISNLKRVGYTHWDGLVFKPIAYAKKSAAIYKASERKKLVKQGYTIIMNIGDQESDFSGGYAERNAKLPNPYYFIP